METDCQATLEIDQPVAEIRAPAQPFGPARARAIELLGQAAERAARLNEKDFRLADLALDNALAGIPHTPGPDPHLAFTRSARALTVVLTTQVRLEETAIGHKRSPADQARDAARATRKWKAARCEEVRTKLNDSLPDASESESFRIMCDIEEMLAGDEISDMLETDTIIDMVKFICEEIGVAPDMRQWSDEELGGVPPLSTEPYVDQINWVRDHSPTGNPIWVVAPGNSKFEDAQILADGPPPDD